MTTHSPPEAVSLAANGTLLSGAVLAAAILTMGLMAGVFGVFTHTIMPGLRHTDDRTFVGAFQAIDKAIINPWFMATFFGALILTGLAAALHLSGDKRNALPWIGAAFVLYLIAVIMAAGNPARIGDLPAVRYRFSEAKWSAWNLIRTLTSTAAFGCLIGAAMMYRTTK